MQKVEQEEKLKEKVFLEQKKTFKQQELKKKQVADYKRKKLEAEDMLANADIEFDDYDQE